MSVARLISLGHGAGGRLTHDLVRDLFAREFANPFLDPLGDAALCPRPEGPIALTTDSFVVDPIFFPGGDIGSLAVRGTVNDLAVAGARPLYLTLGVILEEGLPLDELSRIVASLAAAAREAGVAIVTGDTKVVERGKGDRIFLNTAGVGVLRPDYPRRDRGPRAGDAVLVSGPIGDHGAVILAARRELGLNAELESDCAAVTPLVDALFDAGVVPLFLRDPTRGGLAGVLADLAGEDASPSHVAGFQSKDGPAAGVEIDEEAIPIRSAVRAIGEITGIDPLHLACEGRVVAVVERGDLDRALGAWRALPAGASAAAIGRMGDEHPRRVVLRTGLGGARLLARPTAELLPRIC